MSLNNPNRYAVIGCGDIGRRIIKELQRSTESEIAVSAIVRSEASCELAASLDAEVMALDLDCASALPNTLHKAIWFYLIPPQKQGVFDQRSRRFLSLADQQGLIPSKIVLISTTGVYGDAQGRWVDERSATQPQTERGQRRLDMEQYWSAWADTKHISLCILRVPGIYSYSRIPRSRLESRIPVVRANECGFSNRIHADDLAQACCLASQYSGTEVIFNVSDGTPGKISDYLQAATETLGLDALPEISMSDAQASLSIEMLSYLKESRKISNTKMLTELKVALRYPDYRVGLRHKAPN